jgi:trimethylamine--corrinoid protein Co-methyltransferase
MTDTLAPTRTRSGGRAARRTLRRTRDFTMLPGLTRALPLTEVMDGAEQIARIDAASMDILENVGVVFRDPIALEDWKRAGAEVWMARRVHLDRGLVRDLDRDDPRDFTYHARDPAKNVRSAGRHSIFVPMTGAPYLRDLDDRAPQPDARRSGDVPQAGHMSPALHSSAHHIVEPMDHPISHRHLRITYSSMKHSDKTFMGMTTSPKNAEDVLDMCAILFGEAFMEKTRSSPAIATATRRWSGTRRCWARCARSAAATSRSCARPSCWAAPTRPPRRSRRPWRSSMPRRCRRLAYTQVVRRAAPRSTGTISRPCR